MPREGSRVVRKRPSVDSSVLGQFGFPFFWGGGIIRSIKVFGFGDQKCVFKDIAICALLRQTSSISLGKVLVFPFLFSPWVRDKKILFLTSPLIGLMRSGKIEPITPMGVNSSLQPADTVEGLGELKKAAEHHPTKHSTHRFESSDVNRE